MSSAILEARDGREALRKAERLRPDFITLEISLPDRGGLPLLRSLRSLLPDAYIVVITLHVDRFYRERTAGEGASGFVFKTHLMDELTQLLTQYVQLTYARQLCRRPLPQTERATVLGQ